MADLTDINVPQKNLGLRLKFKKKKKKKRHGFVDERAMNTKTISFCH